MKKLLFVLAIAMLCLTACKKAEKETKWQYFTVTFVQEDQENIVKKVRDGSSLRDVPTPKQIEGYDVKWDKTDFDKITRNLTVSAIYTPKKYVITYDLGICKDDQNVQIEKEEQQVVYGEAYTLYVPICSGYEFQGWTLNIDEPMTYFGDGVYGIAKDITLIAMWEKSSSQVADTTARKKEYCTVTFAQKGQDNIVKKVQKGKTLTDIPAPKDVLGHTVAWDRSDFSNIQKNITVVAVLTPKKYVITYDLGERKNDVNVQMKAGKQTVTYGKAYTLYTPSCKDYAFVGWTLSTKKPITYFVDGLYTQTQDITLIAVWNKIQDQEWTKYY